MCFVRQLRKVQKRIEFDILQMRERAHHLFLQRDAHSERVLYRLPGCGDDPTLTGVLFDEADLCEFEERLSHRGFADAELLCDRRLDDPRTRQELSCEDRFTDTLEDGIREGRGVMSDWFEQLRS
ncbi:hypothetical protein GCM10025768_05360 [Microbacterium pseudoresistens]